jgi:hypothetical protein
LGAGGALAGSAFGKRFGERFAYLRWYRHYLTGECPSNAEIGRVVHRTGQSVANWSALADPPVDWKVHAPLADYLGVTQDWLIRNQGDPPERDLWARWSAQRETEDVPTISASAYIPMTDDVVERMQREEDAKHLKERRGRKGRGGSGAA